MHWQCDGFLGWLDTLNFNSLRRKLARRQRSPKEQAIETFQLRVGLGGICNWVQLEVKFSPKSCRNTKKSHLTTAPLCASHVEACQAVHQEAVKGEPQRLHRHRRCWRMAVIIGSAPISTCRLSAVRVLRNNPVR
eukprot:symbB.v1.2.024661.t1/scaffold2352.1/size103767/7